MRLAFVFAAVLLFPILAACETDAASAPEVNTDSALHSVFALMPDVEQAHGHTLVVDIAALADFLEVPMPGADATYQELANWKLDLFLAARNSESEPAGRALASFWTASDLWLSGMNNNHMGSMPDTRYSLGFDTRDLELIAVAGGAERAPRAPIELVIGDISGESAAASIDACAECVPHETGQHAGAEYYAWRGDMAIDLNNRLALPAHDELGRGGRIRIADGHAYRTLRTSDMEAAIDAETGAGSSLLDNEDWKLAADALSNVDLIMTTATTANADQAQLPELTGAAFAPRDNVPPEFQEWLDSYPELAETVTAASPTLPYHELAVVGLANRDGVIEVAMALVFEDEDAANDAAEALRQRAKTGLRDDITDGVVQWSDSIQEAEFSANGRVVTGRILPTDGAYREFLVRSDVWNFTGATGQGLGPTSKFLLH